MIPMKIGGKMVAGGPAGRPARHRSQPTALRGAAGLRRAGIIALFPLTPGGLGIVEASLSGLLILAGVRGSYAVLACRLTSEVPDQGFCCLSGVLP